MKKISASLTFLSFLPAIAFAQIPGQVSDLPSLISKIDDLVNSTVWLFISLAVIFIVWNGVQFIIHAGGDKRGDYQKAVMWGILGLFIILSIWGLVNILDNTFKLGNANGEGNAQGNIDHLILRRPGPTPAAIVRPT
jgi:uncharacterized membrane protein